MNRPLQTVPVTPWTWIPPVVALIFMVSLYSTHRNQAVFLALNHFGHLFNNAWWANLTVLGDGAVTLALTLPIIRRSPRRFWASLIAAILVTVLVQGGKHLFSLPRPLSVIEPSQFFQTGPKLFAVSFPSGHTAAIFTLVGIWVMSLSGHYLLRTLLFMLAILVGMSRVMVGVHWPMDVLAGMLAGWLSAYAGLWLSARLGWDTHNRGGLVAGSLLLVIAGGLLVSDHTGFPAALVLQKLLGLSCLVWGILEMARIRPRRASTPT